MGGGNWCCAVGCTNSTRNNRGVSFHRFPTEGALREQWQRAVRRDMWKPPSATRVCSEHFHADCYEVNSLLRLDFGIGHGYRKLKPGAVPTLFKYREPPRPPIERGALAKRRRTEVGAGFSFAWALVKKRSCFFFVLFFYSVVVLIRKLYGSITEENLRQKLTQ